MVKIKIIATLIITLSLFSCLNFYRNSKGGLRPKEVRFNLTKNQSLSKIYQIDTLNVYELYSTWMGDYDFNSKRKEDYTIISEYRYYDGTKANLRMFLRFYSNGNLSYFHVENEVELNKEMFNPAKGSIGVYAFDENDILLEMFHVPNYQGAYTKSKARIVDDTLHLINKRSGQYTGKHNIFVKREVPSTYLDWKSDW